MTSTLRLQPTPQFGSVRQLRRWPVHDTGDGIGDRLPTVMAGLSAQPGGGLVLRSQPQMINGVKAAAKRVRVIGDLFHGRVPDGAIYVGRATPGLRCSYFHNPFRVGARIDGFYGDGRVADARHAVDLFEQRAHRLGYPYLEQVVCELSDRDLACWCPLDQPCHVDVLLVLANAP